MRGSERRTTMRPAPSVPRRKSRLLIARPPAAAGAAAAAVGRAAGAAAATAAPAPSPRVIRMLLPTTRVSYACRRSRFSTTRERPEASAATMLSRPAWRTSMRREVRPSAVFGRSKEMRAGLSMVKATGCGAGPFSRSAISRRWPGSVCTSTASRRAPEASAASAAGAVRNPAGKAAKVARTSARRKWVTAM